MNPTTTRTSTTKNRSLKKDDPKIWNNKKNRSKKALRIKKQFKTQNQILKEQ